MESLPAVHTCNARIWGLLEQEDWHKLKGNLDYKVTSRRVWIKNGTVCFGSVLNLGLKVMGKLSLLVEDSPGQSIFWHDHF